MSEITGMGHRTTGTAVVHEAYSFACMRCGHGWEQSYAIEHHLDAEGRQFVVYTADGRRVPSPLSRPSCHNCGHDVVRIMRPGRVSSARESMASERIPMRQAAGGAPAGSRLEHAPGDGAERHAHLSDVLRRLVHGRLFHGKAA